MLALCKSLWVPTGGQAKYFGVRFLIDVHCSEGLLSYLFPGGQLWVLLVLYGVGGVGEWFSNSMLL